MYPNLKWKMDLSMEALSIACRNTSWLQYFNQILIWLVCLTALGLATLVQAAIDSRATTTTVARPKAAKWTNQIKIWLQHCDQVVFLLPMLSAFILKCIFYFWIWMPNLYTTYFVGNAASESVQSLIITVITFLKS